MEVIKNPQKKSKKNPNTPASIASHHAGRVYFFGSFCVNQAEKQLLRAGKPIRLSPKKFSLLLVLIQNRGSLVSKERLLEEVWPNVFVEEANLTVNIASLRKVLHEGDERPCIETVPKRGYRFVARVRELDHDDSTESIQVIASPNGNGQKEILNSVAVLPFENDGCGPTGDYLSAGLMESITNTLSQSRGLRVMARHTVYSHHPCNTDPRTVGENLGVRSILLGRILPLDDLLIVRAELVDVENGWQLWGEQYHTRISDVLLAQQELTQKITEELRTRLKIVRFNALAAKLVDRHATYSPEASTASPELAASSRLRDLRNLIHLRNQSRQ